MAVTAGKLYFTAYDEFGRPRLWMSDGKTSGTEQISDPGINDVIINEYTGNESTVFFSGNTYQTGNELYDRWKKGLKEMGYKADTRNDAGGSVYLRTKTGTKNSVVGAWFFTGRNLFSVGIELPFAVPDTYNELDQSKRTLVLQQYPKLYAMLMAIAEVYVVPADFIYYKAPGKTLSQEQRIFGFTQFWTEVKYNFAFFDAIPDWRYDPLPGQVYIDLTPDGELRMCIRYIGTGHFSGALKFYPYDDNAPVLHGNGTFVQCAAIDRYHFNADGLMYEGETVFDLLDATQSAGILPGDDSLVFKTLFSASRIPAMLNRFRSRG